MQRTECRNEKQKKRQRKDFPQVLAAETSASKATLCVINTTAVKLFACYVTTDMLTC